MTRQILFCLSIIVLLANSAFTQTRDGQSIVIKFRTTAALNSPTEKVLSVLASASPVAIANAQRIIPIGRNTPLSVGNNFGLDRIIILPLYKNISVDSVAALLSTNSEIEYAEPNHITHIDLVTKPNDSLYNEQWAHTAMDVLGAWKTTKGSKNIRIGFIDTGVNWDHPDLIAQFAVNSAEDINHNGLFDAWSSNETHLDAKGNAVKGDLDGIDQDGNGYVDDVIGYDFVDQQVINFGDAKHRDAIPFDEESHSHGTAVASVIGAISNNTIGLSGIAPDCKLVALRAFDATGNAEDDDVASAIIYAADNGVRILNLSFGDVVPSMLQRDAIRYANSKGVLVVASSGNAGGDGRHYPSDFNECLSVGMTTRDQDGNEVIAVESQHGEAMDLVAPGGGINVLSVDGYQLLSGTSFSAPAVAAVAGLVLASHSNLSNDEIRSILASTTDDQFPLGFDHTHANGRVNAKRAVEYIGGANIKLTSPHTDDRFHICDPIVIKGNAVSPLLKYYTISYAKGLNPDNDLSNPIQWTVIDSSTKQVLTNTLATFNTSGLLTGTYTLRLSVATTDSRLIEERMNIVLVDTPRLGITFRVDTLFDNEKRMLLVTGRTPTPTRAALLYKRVGTTSFQAKNDDRLTRNHSVALTTNDVEAGVPLDLKLTFISSSGDSTSISSQAILPNEAISHTGFTQKPYSLPSGYALDSVIGGNTIIESVAPAGVNYGSVTAFTFDKALNKFAVSDHLDIQSLPRAIGNVKGNGKTQVLLQAGGNDIYVYQSNATHSIFGDIVYADTTSGLLFATSLADADGDGKDELVAMATIRSGSSLFQQFEVDRIQTDRVKLGSLVNNTNPAPHYGANNFSIPDSRSADFIGNGSQQIAILDDDADLNIYKYDATAPTAFANIFTDENDGYTESRNIAVGDFNGDGKPDVALAYHKSFDVNDDNEYDYNYWTVKVLFNSGNGSFSTAYSDYFNTVRSLNPYRASIGAIKNVTGKSGDNLALSFFPNFYLLGYDPNTKTMHPIWHNPIANSPRGALAYDFDGNGKREFGFVAGDSLEFFEYDQSLADRAPSPTGFEVIPRDVNRVDLRWSPVENAAKYYILRADNIPNAQFDIIDSITTTSYSDTGVSNGDTYFYSVASLVPTFTNTISNPAPSIFAFVHPTPKLRQLLREDNILRVYTTQPLSQNVISGNQFVIDEEQGASTAIIGGDSLIVLTLDTTPTIAQTHTLRIRSFDVRDIWNSPFDTSQIVQWTSSPVITDVRFYISRWRFEGSTRISVEFTMRPDDNALDINNYSLSPFGTIISARRDAKNDSAVYLDLKSSTSLTPIGKSYILCAEHITSGGFQLETTSGNCVGETPTASTLEHLFTYPSPVRATDETMTFAGLTAQAEISIYTPELRLIKRLSTTERSGGVQWDMHDENGKSLPSGIYIYHVTGKDDNGKSVESNESKFVIIRDR